MPRLFTAIEIPADVAQTLTFLRGGLPGARWIDPENYHITLRFIGDVDVTVAHDVASMLDRVSRAAFELRLDGVSSFGGRKPRAVVANVAPSQALMDLQAEHDRLMQRVGLAPEGRKYTPHVTLARLRDLIQPAGRGLSERARFVPLGAVPRRTLRALFVARLGRWRAVCGGSGLSARDRSGEARDLSAHCLRRAGHADEIDAAEAVLDGFGLRPRHQGARQRVGLKVGLRDQRRKPGARGAVRNDLDARRASGPRHRRRSRSPAKPEAANNARRPRGRHCRPRRTGSGRDNRGEADARGDPRCRRLQVP